MHCLLRDHPYTDPPDAGGRCRLDLHWPDGEASPPALLWFHGGGLSAGERNLPEGLRDQGVAVVCADYRLHPQTRAPGYLEDAAAAAAWTLRELPARGIPPHRIFLTGASAGAYLALMLLLDKRWMARHQLDPDSFAGLVSLSGQAITHFAIRAERGLPGHQALIDELAPLHHVRPDAPPICLVTGDRELELLGRYEENAYFLRMLRVAGHHRNELHELPGHDHGAVEAAALPILLDFLHRVTDGDLPPRLR